MQVSVSEVAGHNWPPLAGCTVMARVRLLVPPPHSTEHVENAPQSATAQSTGHACVLQSRV